jgi:hypothetical protein
MVLIKLPIGYDIQQLPLELYLHLLLRIFFQQRTENNFAQMIARNI